MTALIKALQTQVASLQMKLTKGEKEKELACERIARKEEGMAMVVSKVADGGPASKENGLKVKDKTLKVSACNFLAHPPPFIARVLRDEPIRCHENSDPESSDLRPQTPKTQTPKTQTPKFQTPRLFLKKRFAFFEKDLHCKLASILIT